MEYNPWLKLDYKINLLFKTIYIQKILCNLLAIYILENTLIM